MPTTRTVIACNIELEQFRWLSEIHQITGLSRSAILREALDALIWDIEAGARVNGALRSMVDDCTLIAIDPDTEGEVTFRLREPLRTEAAG